MPETKTKVLHILGSLRFGGVESWLLRLLRRMDRSRFETVFVVSELSGSEYEEEARRLGATIELAPVSVGLVQYALNLSTILSQRPGFDAVHSHVHAFSAVTLFLAQLHGVPVRIAHSHTDRHAVEASARLSRKAYLLLAKALLHIVMTNGLAVTEAAAKDLFGKRYQRMRNIVVQPCGVEIEAFLQDVDRAVIRKTFGIPVDAKVIGHVGNFVQPKNHELLIRIFAAVLAQNSNWHLVLVGSGALQAECEQQVDKLGIAHRVHFLGARSDVPALLKGLVDVFVFPSKWEGLPVALIEAQAANLPCVISDVISTTAIALGASVTRLPLESDISVWADAITEKSVARSFAPQADLSKFDIENSVATLQRIYPASKKFKQSLGSNRNALRGDAQ